jgi:hypothetical protein
MQSGYIFLDLPLFIIILFYFFLTFFKIIYILIW